MAAAPSGTGDTGRPRVQARPTRARARREALLAPAAPAPAAPRHAKAAREELPEGYLSSGDFEEKSAARKLESVPTSPRASKSAARRSTPTPPSAPPRVARTPSYDWGGVTHLSNDDSMSLASAQRLLYAVRTGGRIDPAGIRAHELLNYFHFDAPAPTGTQTFGVGVSAERTDESTLSLALSVRAVTPPRPPLDLTVLVDRSDSMRDDGKMAFLERGLNRLAEQLHPGDHVDLVAFDNHVETILSDLDVGKSGSGPLLGAIERISPQGSTDMDAGLREAYRLARRHTGKGREHRVLLITDARLNTGSVDPDVVSEIGAAMNGAGIHLSAVGVGSDVQDAVLDALTEKGHGAYVFLGSEAVVDRVFGEMFPALTQTAADDVRFSLDLPPSLAIARFYGEEASTSAADIQPVRVGAGTTQLFLEDLAIKKGRLAPKETVTLNLAWTDPATGARKTDARSWTVEQLLAAGTANVRKARALMGWVDEVRDRATGGGCKAAWNTWQERFALASGDEEVAYVNGILRPCAAPVARRRESPLKIKVDADEPIAEVGLQCGGRGLKDALSPADTVAVFAEAPVGSCDVTLLGAQTMRAKVQVTATRGDVRCTVRAGRATCS